MKISTGEDVKLYEVVTVFIRDGKLLYQVGGKVFENSSDAIETITELIYLTELEFFEEAFKK